MPEEKQQRLKILLVDDQSYNILMMEMILERIGCHYESVLNGRDALEKLSSMHFDLVLMDCMMPELTGSDVIRIVRNSETEYSDIPIVCISSMRNDLSSRCRDCRINGSLNKPLMKNSLIDMLSSYEANYAQGNDLCIQGEEEFCECAETP